jgi:hypothetical protein
MKPKPRRLDASAARAEAILLQNVNKPNRPIEDNIRGAFSIFTVGIGQSYPGYNYAYVNLEGFWAVSTVILSSSSPEFELGEIDVKPLSSLEYLPLTSGTFGYLRSLEWSGRLLLQGQWVIRARRYAVTSTTDGGHLNVLAEKISEAST